MSRMILVGYDGSAPADRAVDRAAALFADATLVVATVWSPVRETAAAARVALPDSVIASAVHDLDTATQAETLKTAEAGAERARASGVEATAVAVPAGPSTWRGLLDAADEHEAEAIVVGARGRSGLASMVLGSVSSAIVFHSRRPVVVVPDKDRPASTP